MLQLYLTCISIHLTLTKHKWSVKTFSLTLPIAMASVCFLSATVFSMAMHPTGRSLSETGPSPMNYFFIYIILFSGPILLGPHNEKMQLSKVHELKVYILGILRSGFLQLIRTTNFLVITINQYQSRSFKLYISDISSLLTVTVNFLFLDNVIPQMLPWLNYLQ